MISQKDQEFIEKVIKIFTDNSDKVVIEDNEIKSLSLSIYKPINPENILDGKEPIIAYEVYLVYDEFKLELSVSENQLAGRGVWMKISAPVQIMVYHDEIDDTKFYNELVAMFDNIIKYRDNEKETKRNNVINEFLMDQLTFTDPLEVLYAAYEKRQSEKNSNNKSRLQEPSIMDFSSK